VSQVEQKEVKIALIKRISKGNIYNNMFLISDKKIDYSYYQAIQNQIESGEISPDFVFVERYGFIYNTALTTEVDRVAKETITELDNLYGNYFEKYDKFVELKKEQEKTLYPLVYHYNKVLYPEKEEVLKEEHDGYPERDKKVIKLSYSDGSNIVIDDINEEIIEGETYIHKHYRHDRVIMFSEVALVQGSVLLNDYLKTLEKEVNEIDNKIYKIKDEAKQKILSMLAYRYSADGTFIGNKKIIFGEHSINDIKGIYIFYMLY